MKNIIIGTSGHIDHGKSALVKALTGIDPDRFEEEKKRGITIDIGFAHYNWQDRLNISFIDVPGHERFVHNMLAGVGGIHILLLAIAADGGVMPQTKEHLHICDLLGIKNGIVVLTRCDLADEEMVELVEEEVSELVQGTFLENSPIIKTSAIKGTGLPELQEEIARIADSLEESTAFATFRLPVDRCFSLKGFGTIVTGTVHSGKAGLEDNLMLYPQKESLRIRGFQVHGEKAGQIKTGQRSAINLTGLQKDQIDRGNQIAFPGHLVNTSVIEVELKIIPDKAGVLKNKSKLRFFSNAQEVTGRLYAGDEFDPESTEMQFVQLRLESEISCRYADRFIIRSLSPMHTIAGGRIIAPFGNRSRKNKHRLQESLKGLASQDETQRIQEAVFLSGTKGIMADQMVPLVGSSQKTIQKSLQALASRSEVVSINNEKKKYLHVFHNKRLAGFFVRTLKAFHKKNPEKPGAMGPDFFGKMSLTFSHQEVISSLNWAVKQKFVAQTDNVYHLPGFEGGMNEKQKKIKEHILANFRQMGFQPPGVVNLAKELAVDQKDVEKILKIGQSEKWVIKAKDDLWYLPETIDDIKKSLLGYFSSNETLTVGDFKELIGVSRKHAVGLLEYFDGQHLTRRIENHRVLHKEQ